MSHYAKSGRGQEGVQQLKRGEVALRQKGRKARNQGKRRCVAKYKLTKETKREKLRVKEVTGGR